MRVLVSRAGATSVGTHSYLALETRHGPVRGRWRELMLTRSPGAQSDFALFRIGRQVRTAAGSHPVAVRLTCGDGERQGETVRPGKTVGGTVENGAGPGATRGPEGNDIS